jgi:hypothetical protein
MEYSEIEADKMAPYGVLGVLSILGVLGFEK